MSASRTNWIVPVAAIATLILFVLVIVLGREPSFEGRSASQWFALAQNDPANLDRYAEVFQRWNQAGVRFLCRRLVVETPRWKRALIEVNNRYGSKVGLKPRSLSNNQREQQTARRLLGYFEAGAVPQLLKMLDSKSGANQLAALQALLELGPAAAERAGPRLVSLLNHSSESVIYEAMTTLPVIGYDPALVVPQLVPFLQHKNQRVRIEASYALGTYPPMPEVTLLPLIGSLADADSVVRANAARALGAMGGAARSALGPLGENLDQSGLPSARAVEAIALIVGEVPAGLRESFDQAHARHLLGGDHYNRLMVLHASIRLGWELDQLESTSRALLPAPQNWQVWETIQALAELDPRPAWVNPLLTQATRHPNGRVRALANGALKPGWDGGR